MTNRAPPSAESIARGEALYNARVEYPLPVLPGVQDYIFYFAKNGDEYIRDAREFLGKVYPRHREFRNVQHLSEIIDRLHADITSGTVQRPREIVLVGHATPHSIDLGIMPNRPAPLKETFRLTDLLSLFELQKAVRAGGNAQIDQLDQKRRLVVDRLTDESWVVLRACRFGQNPKAVHALYAFFGGRANLYAALDYTFFASSGIGPGKRFASRQDVYEHMAAQRMVSPRRRTPDRKLSLVNMVAEPGFATSDASVRSANLSQDSQARTDYLDDIAILEAGIVPQSVVNALQANFAITLDQPVVSMAQGGSGQNLNTAGYVRFSRWVFREKLSTEFDIFEPELKYLPSEVFELEVIVEDTRLIPDDETGELSTRARLKDRQVGKTGPDAAFQLMLEDMDNDAYKGFLFTLAERAQSNPSHDELKDYVAVKSALDALVAGVDGGATERLENLLNDRADFVANPGTLTIGPDLANLSWRLSVNGDDYIVVEDEYQLVDGEKFFRLRLKSAFEGNNTQADHEKAHINDARWGVNSDIPGVELMAWLDRLSIDELKDLIDFLDSVTDTRRVRLAHTWRHAADALGDKHPSRKALGEPNFKDPLFGILDAPYYSIYEYESRIGGYLDESNTSYQFASRRHWRQAKDIFVLDPPVQSDLFTEKTLPTPPGFLRDDPFVPDSPSFKAAQLSPREREIYGALTGGRKFDARMPDAVETECEAFRRWMMELVKVSDLPDGDIDAALAALPELDRPQEGNALLFAISVMGVLGTLLEQTSFGEKVAIGLSARFPRIANLRVPFIGLNPTQLMGALSLLGTVWTVGSYMLLNFFADVHEASNSVRRAGAGFAFRQYALRLNRRIAAHAPDFPTTLNIDIRPPPGEDPGIYAIKVAQAFNSNPNGTHFNDVYFGEKKFLGEGYMTGAALAEKAAQRALDNAQWLFNSALRKAGLKQCMVDALRDSGFVQPGRVRAFLMREAADQIERAGQPSSKGE